MKNLKLVLIMFVLAVTNVTFGSINYKSTLNDCGCGCGKKEGPPPPIVVDKKLQAIGDDESVICEAR